MNSKKIGYIVIGIAIVLIVLGIYLRSILVQTYNTEFNTHSDGACSATAAEPCPHEKINNLLWPTLIGATVLIILAAIGVYLIFFEKSQKILEQNQQNIVKTLEETHKQKDSEEKFQLLLSALDEDEKNVMKTVREQDGITQATLRIRIGLSKTKLSIVLSGLEKKDLIRKIAQGKTNQVFLKRQI
ncbi:MAG: hypothetical protein AABW41_00590 [Nanoarchaeota archaeon]